MHSSGVCVIAGQGKPSWQCLSSIALGQTFVERTSAGEAVLWPRVWEVGVHLYLQWADRQVVSPLKMSGK